jgi:AcrR family transcriptional regulator
MNDTKQKILDTAERLFGERGYDAVSLRQVIGEAGVNLAAVHYHFGSKEELLDEVVLRKLRPVNEARIARLDELEAVARGAALPVESILRAFLIPTTTVARKSPEFAKLMGRIVAEGHIQRLAKDHLMPLLERFGTALERSLPAITREELGWRIYFMFGAVSQALSGTPQLWLTGEEGDFRDRIEKLIAFLRGAFEAAPALQVTRGPEPIEVSE